MAGRQDDVHGRTSVVRDTTSIATAGSGLITDFPSVPSFQSSVSTQSLVLRPQTSLVGPSSPLATRYLALI